MARVGVQTGGPQHPGVNQVEGARIDYRLEGEEIWVDVHFKDMATEGFHYEHLKIMISWPTGDGYEECYEVQPRMDHVTFTEGEFPQLFVDNLVGDVPAITLAHKAHESQ